MLTKPLCLALFCLSAWAQSADTAALDSQAAALKALVRQSRRLSPEKTVFKIQAPGAGWEIGYPSSVAMDGKGAIYVLQRGEKADPVLVMDRQSRILRSWGKGMFKIPHSIRIDPQGNIWTVDSSSSMVMKFTPAGDKLMEISVGEQPAGRGPTNGTTDIAFGPHRSLFISDGYGNARVLEYTAKGERVRQWGSDGAGPGQFRQPHGIAIDDDGVVYVADRLNGRLQRFDLKGKYLGEWDDLGMVTTVAIRDWELWIGTQQRNEPTGSDGWIMKIDRKTGKVLGYVESAHGRHIVNVSKSGDLFSGARPDTVLWFHSAK